MPNPTNSKEPAKATLKNLHSINDVTPEMLENVDKSDRGKMIQLVLDTPEAKKLVKELRELKKTAEKSGLKFEDQLIIGDQSLRELTNNRTDTAKNEETLLQFAALHIGVANQKKLPSTFRCPVPNETDPEVTVDVSDVSSFGKSSGIIATILELLSEFLKLFQKNPEQVKEDHNKRVDDLRMDNLRKFYLSANKEKVQELKEEMENAEKDQENFSPKELEDLYNDIADLAPNDKIVGKDSKDLPGLISQLSTPAITKKILHAAPALRELDTYDFRGMNPKHRRQAMLAKFQLALMENNIKCYTAAKDNKLDAVREHGIALMNSYAAIRDLFTLKGTEKHELFYQMYQLRPNNYINHIRSEFPAGIAIVASNAAFGQTLESVFDEYGHLYSKDIPKHTSAILRSTNEAAAKKIETPNKEEIQKKTPEMSGPMA